MREIPNRKGGWVILSSCRIVGGDGKRQDALTYHGSESRRYWTSCFLQLSKFFFIDSSTAEPDGFQQGSADPGLRTMFVAWWNHIARRDPGRQQNHQEKAGHDFRPLDHRGLDCKVGAKSALPTACRRRRRRPPAPPLCFVVIESMKIITLCVSPGEGYLGLIFN